MNSTSLSSDTIAAIATPLGEGGLGVVRISGPDAFSVADKLFRGSAPLAQAVTHTLHHGWIVDGPRSVDETVAAIFRSPASYTGDDVVEFSCHGSPAVLKFLMELCQRHGVRPARAGEFTERAFLNGKLDLAQAEAVADLIHARSTKAHLAAADQLRGGLSRRIEAIRNPLIDLLAHLEANLDFVEEAIPGLPLEKAQSQLTTLLQTLSALLETAHTGRLLREGLYVALVGRPNAGKSSLFNALLKTDRAIVTDVPGTTRDTIEEATQWNGVPVVLIDTAGLRSGGDQVERLGHERAKRALARADFLIAVVDGSEPIQSDHHDFLFSLKDKPVLVAINKADLPPAWSEKYFPLPPSFSSILVSAKTDQGLAELRQAVLARVDAAKPETEAAGFAVSERHRVHLAVARERLNTALAALKNRRSEESIGWDLREAVRSLDRITGADVDEDVLSAVFRQFCIGK